MPPALSSESRGMKTKTPKRITIAWLSRRNGCPSGIEAFESVFGRSAAFTSANVRKALADSELKHHLTWIVYKLSPRAYTRILDGERKACAAGQLWNPQARAARWLIRYAAKGGVR